MARCCGIPNCFAITVEEVSLCLKVCLEKCDYFRKHGKQHRRKHLYQCLDKAREREDEDREKEILAIIQREKDRSFWRRLNYVMGKPRRLSQKGLSGKRGSGRNADREYHPGISSTGNL
jgi:hypothetical protein